MGFRPSGVMETQAIADDISVTTAASPGTLAAAWPELQADPARAAAYAAALEGLDPAAVAAVSDALRREGRPLPKPGIFRVAVLARAPRGPAGPPPPLQPPPPPPAVPRARTAGGRRDVSDIVAMTILGLAGLFTIGGPTVAWVRTPSGATLTGSEAFGGFVSAAGFTAFAIAVIGAVYLWRRRSARHLLQAYLLAAVVFCVTTVVTIGAYGRIAEVPGLATAAGYWNTLAMVVAGAGVAIWRCLATWRRSRAEGGLGRAAITFAALTVALGLGLVAIYAAAYRDAVPPTSAAPVAAGAAGRGTPALGEARQEYIDLTSHRGAEMRNALAALQRATQEGDPAAALGGVRLMVTSLESARNGLAAARALNRPPFAARTGRLVAGLDAQARAARRILEAALAGRPPTQEEIAAITAADRLTIAADRGLRAALGFPVR